MVKVEMPRGNWESILAIIDSYNQTANSPFIDILMSEISDQVYNQEY